MIAAAPVAAAPPNPGVEELWKQFPLDAGRDAPAAPDSSSDDPGNQAPAPPEQPLVPTPIPPEEDADADAGAPVWIAFAAGGIALLFLAGFYLARVRMRARPPVRSPQLQAITLAAPPRREPPPAHNANALARSEPPPDAGAAATNGASAGTKKRAQTQKSRAQPARTRTPAAKRESARDSAPPPAPAAVAAARAQRAQECEVRWWRGYAKSQFIAVVMRADGAETCLAQSPFFRWGKSGPPPESPAATAALRALVESLEDKGWAVAGRDEHWFDLRLRPASSDDRAETAGVNQSGT